MSETEIQLVKKATIYDLRLILTNGDKKEYTVDELLELLDAHNIKH